MANFQFKKGDEAVSLDKIDEEICNFFGEKVKENEFHPVYDVIVDLGFKTLMSGEGGYSVTKKDFDYLLEKNKVAVANPEFQKYLPVFRKFLYEDYTFTAWR